MYINSSHKNELSPFNLAVSSGKTEIVKILAPLMDNPNVSHIKGLSILIKLAEEEGYTEILKILAPFREKLNAPTKNLNVLDKNGDTQIDVAQNAKLGKNLSSFKTSTKRKAGPSPTQSQKRAKKF